MNNQSIKSIKKDGRWLEILTVSEEINIPLVDIGFILVKKFHDGNSLIIGDNSVSAQTQECTHEDTIQIIKIFKDHVEENDGLVIEIVDDNNDIFFIRREAITMVRKNYKGEIIAGILGCKTQSIRVECKKERDSVISKMKS